MKKKRLWPISIIVLVLLSLLTIVPTVYGFEGRGGNEVIIEAGEIINDDLYIGANRFVLEGTVDGDLVVGAREIVINGRVIGDLWGAAQNIIINGTIEDDAHLAGGIILLESNAQIRDDLLASGFGVEMVAGASLGGDLVSSGYQTLMAGQVGKSALVSSNAVDVRGSISGDLEASVGDPNQRRLPFSAFSLIPNTPPIETLAPGLMVAETAQIGGNLIYESPAQIEIPEGAVAGAVQFEEMQPEDNQQPGKDPNQTPTIRWLLKTVKKLVALLFLASLITWLFPGLIKKSVKSLKSKPGPSVGVGALIFFLFPVLAFLVILVFVLLVLLFNFFGLGNLAGIFILVGLTVLMLLVTGFLVAVIYLAKIILGFWLGERILTGLNIQGSPSVFLTTLLGVFLIAVFISVPWIGWLLSFVVDLFGLGALWFGVFTKGT